MADVLIVCVREDEPQAKALAEMFEAAGFSIGGAPSSDGALRSSGAGVVVWSQASIRSRPFLDAAQRVINANKAVVASLIEPPPPSSIGESPAFDLSRWDGDPNDPSLDPLFFAVDRMVNSARTSVGGREDAYEEAPPAPAPRAAPRPAPAPARAPQRSEAEHWRSISDSRDPSDFMDYLKVYGAHGEFAELAELRLKQLTAGRAAAAAPRPAPPPPPPPQPRYVPPPRVEARREPPPPPRRAEPPPPQRRMPPPERFDRNDLRDPPRGEGGALRAFVLIALLGGAALAGGLYFGGGMGDPNADAPQEEIVGAPSLDAPSEVPLSEDGEAIDATPPQQTASLDTAEERERERERAREREREQERQRQREERERAAATPPPATTTAAATPSSGPVSLTPNTTPNQPPPSTVVPLGPSTAPISTPSRPPPSQAAVTRPAAGTVSWAQRPTARRIADLYPQRALREGIGGRVTLDCVVQASLGVSCNVASESPAGEGFGRAALTASSSYRASPTLSDGASAVGARTRLSVSFQAPQ